MSNVTVQAALKAAILHIEANYMLTGDDESLSDLNLCKSALSSLEKCEPVALVTNKYGDPERFAERELAIDNKLLQKLPIGTELYDKPQPRDWVGLDLSEYEVQGLGAIAEEICEKLKQLNTKG